MTDYTKTTDFTSKDSLPSGDSGKIIRGAEFGTEFDNIETAVNSKSNINNPSFTGNITVTGTVDGRDIAADGTKLDTIETSADVTDTANVTAAGAVMDSELTDITAVKALNQGVATTDSPTFAAVTSTGNVTVGGTVDGRDVAADGTKLDTVETNADVTDTTNVTAAGALMDSEVTNLDQVKAFDSSDYATAAQGTTADNALPKTGGAMTGAITTNSTFDGRDVATDGTKLDGIEALADVTDTANVTAAGALMDSELTDIAAVKALNQGVATTDSPTFAGATVNGTVEFDGLSGTGAVTVTDILDQDDMSGNSATALATQQSIKSYVDSQVATSDTLAEVLANGNTTGGTDVAFGDNDKATFGAGSDLQIYHTGTQNYIEDAGTGNLNFKSNGNFYNFLNGSNATVFQIDLDDATRLYHNATQKLATTSTGIDVTGTLVSDGLTVDGATTTNIDGSNYTFSGTDYDVHLLVGSAGGGVRLGEDSVTHNSVIGTTGTNDLDIVTYNGSAWGKRARFDNSGDISFYEDTGTTAKFFWDAAAESLGIGTSSPNANLEVIGNYRQKALDGNSQGFNLTINNTTDVVDLTNYYNAAMTFGTNNTERMRIDSSGNVGIGATSAPSRLTVKSPDNTLATNIAQFDSLNGGAGFKFGYQRIEQIGATTPITFETGGSESMRIDSSGNVSIGTSNSLGVLTIKSTASDDQDIITITEDGTNQAFSINGNFAGAGSTGNAITLDSYWADDIIVFRGDGNVGIGTSSPSAPLTVQSDTGASTINLVGRASDGYSTLAFRNNADNATLAALFADEDSDDLQIHVAGTEAMRIDSSGDVGIGVTSPDATLTVSSGSANNVANFKSTDGTAYIAIADNSSTSALHNQIGVIGDNMYFATNDTERMRIDSSGNLLVGTTTSTGYGLHEIRGDNSSGGTAALTIYNSNAADAATAANLLKNSATTTSSQRFMQFYCNAGLTAMGGIVGNGASNIQFATISDAREKTNIEGISGSLDKINTLNPVEFDWIASGEHVSAGFVAQEVEQVFPEFVVENMADEGAEERKGLTGGMTGGIVAHLVKAIQEQNELINDLRARVAQLETN